MRRRLVEAAARELAASGPGGLTARRVTAAAGTSTMAVYSHFGSMQALVRAVIEHGFSLLEEHLVAVPASADPVRDVVAQTRAYLAYAGEHPELYAVMFLTMPLGPYRPTSPAELRTGRRETLDRIGANLARAAESGRISAAPQADLAFTWWSAVHGYAMLESSGHIHRNPGRTRILQRLLVALFTGLGDAPATAAASVRQGLAS